MLTPKFNLPCPAQIKWINALTIIASLCALMLWHAPLSDRLWTMSTLLLLSLSYFFWLGRYYLKRYPATLSFEDETWYLGDKKVTIEPSTILTAHYAALCFKDASKKKYRLMATPRSFLASKDYHHFIRFLKTHRGSF